MKPTARARRIAIVAAIAASLPVFMEAQTHHYEYVFQNGHIDVYDTDNHFASVKSLSVPTLAGVLGSVASAATGMLYLSYGSNSAFGSLLKYDLVKDQVVWTTTYPSFGIDSMAISPDGKTIYLPSGEHNSSGLWQVIDAATGKATGSIATGGSGAHNTVVNLNGTHVYMAGTGYNYLVEADTATHKIIQKIGPVTTFDSPGVRPFTINGAETLAFMTATGVLGFQVGDIATGKILYTVPITGFSCIGCGGGVVPSHGISLSPDEKEVYVRDSPNFYVHVFDVSGLPGSAPKQVADIPMVSKTTNPGWLHHSLDGRYVFDGDSGDVIDTKTRKVVGELSALSHTARSIEIDFQNGVPVFAMGNRSSRGTVTAPGLIDSVTFHGDRQRTGWQQNETILTPQNVGGGTFGPIWNSPVFDKVGVHPAHTYASPLYIDALTMSTGVYSGSTLSVVLAATSNGFVYAVNAFATTVGSTQVPAGTILWSRNLGPPGDNANQDQVPLGVLGTPVVDTSTSPPRLYVVNADSSAGHLVFALDITNGSVLPGWPVAINNASLAPINQNGPALFQGTHSMSQRGGLNLSPDGKLLYVAFGAYTDGGAGWVVAVNTQSPGLSSAFSGAPSSATQANGGMWASSGVAIDSTGNVFSTAGNGTTNNENTAGYWGNSLLAWGPGAPFSLTGTYSPFNYCQLDINDSDISGGGAMLLPSLADTGASTPNLIAFGGKQGNVYLLDKDHLPGSLSVRQGCGTDASLDRSLLPPGNQPQFGTRGPLNVFGPYSDQYTTHDWAKARSTPAFWRGPDGTPYLFATGSNKANADSKTSVPPGIYRLKVVTSPGQPAYLQVDGSEGTVTFLTPGSPVVTSDGYGNAIVWVLVANVTRYQPLTPSQPFLVAFDALTLQKIYQSSPGDLFPGGKYSTPVIAHGTVFVATDRIQALSLGVTAPPPGIGSLTGSGDSSTTAVDLTAEGATDWVHWGDPSLNRKAVPSALVSNYTVVGSGVVQNYSTDSRLANWSDGSSTVSSTNNPNGVNTGAVGKGFSFTAPADASVRQLIVHVGGSNSGGTLTAHLSDGSAPDFVDTSTSATAYDRNYTLTYNAASPNQTLNIKWVMTSGVGNVALSAAALTNSGSITATDGTPQSALVNTAFPTSLQVTVLDATNSPVSGATVTFKAPASGASGEFSGGTTAVAMTDGNGIASAILTANGTAGSYSVTASAPGAGMPAAFSLTNQAGAPSSVSPTAGTPQSASMNALFGTALQAIVKDSGGNPVSGVTVSFLAPASGASGTFTGGITAIDVLSASDGTAMAPAFQANGQLGSYVVTASVVGVATPASFNLTNIIVVSGSLSGAVDIGKTAVNLTSEGVLDWVHWGDATLNRKASVAAQISTYALVGGGSVSTYGSDPRPLSWTDGTPTASSSNNLKGVFTAGAGKGFSITAPADTTTRTLMVHLGGWNSAGTLTAHLSDSSAADFTNAVALVSGSYDRNYTLVYSAASAGKSLTVTWTMTSGSGNVTLNGASLSSSAGGIVPHIAATAGASQSTTVGTAFGTSLQATVLDAGNNPVSGAAVTFAAPGSGASGAFSGSATVDTDITGVATAPAFTANSIAGSYTVTASTPGAATTASFNLTNQAGVPASVTATGGTSQGATISTAFANHLAATVKDSSVNPVNGVTVTFTAPGTGASGTFSNGFATVDVLTAADGTATAPTFTANSTTGPYTVTASVTGVALPASFNLSNNAVAVGASLAGVGDSLKTAVDLAAQGALDWVHWGDASVNRKSGVPAQISTYTLVGGGTATKYSNDPRPMNWTGGTPTATGANNLNGVYIPGIGKGFSITAPADTTTRTMVVHVGGWSSGGILTAHLSGGGAADFTDTTTTVSGQYDRNYTITYKAAAAGQTLTVTWKMNTGTGNITLNGAALQ